MKIDGCGNGGWTPVMKIDGDKVLFLFHMSIIILQNGSFSSSFDTFIKIYPIASTFNIQLELTMPISFNSPL